MSDVTLNQPTLALLGAVWLVLSSVIISLFNLVKGRMTRAEGQVDLLIPLAKDTITELKAMRTDMLSEFKAVRDETARLRDERRGGGA